MKNIIFVLILLAGCTSNHKFEFPSIECQKGPMPEYDGKEVSLKKDGVAYKDTIIEKIEKRRDIFKPCRTYYYNALFSDKNGKTITDSRIMLVATGKRWSFNPEIQDEVVVQYEFDQEDIAKGKKFEINKTLHKSGWVRESRTGIIENVEQIWMHPFRNNQFSSTEVAPFPQIRFPLKIGKTWFGGLHIQQGWGDWENTSGNFSYRVDKQEDIKIAYGNIKGCWFITSESSYPFGKSKLNYWFSEQFGFVRMEYQNYAGQKIKIELMKMEEK